MRIKRKMSILLTSIQWIHRIGAWASNSALYSLHFFISNKPQSFLFYFDVLPEEHFTNFTPVNFESNSLPITASIQSLTDSQKLLRKRNDIIQVSFWNISMDAFNDSNSIICYILWISISIEFLISSN